MVDINYNCAKERAVNICFSDSAAALLGQAFPKTPVLCLREDLSIGEISNLSRRYEAPPHILGDMGAHPCLDFAEKLPRLCAGADVCLWYSHAPFEYCGMLFAAFTLHSENMAASAINVCERGFPSVQDALCAAPAGSFIDSRRYPDMGQLSEKWQKIASENGFLRIWDSGGIRSAGEDFFDKLLLKYMEKFSDTEQAALAAHGEYSAKAALFNIYFFIERTKQLKRMGKNEKTL